MRKWIKVSLIILAVIVVLIAAGAILIADGTKKLNAIADMQIEDVDLSGATDGTYEGKYSAFPIIVKVSVTIKDQQVTTIELLKHFNGQGGAADVIPGKVVEAQSLQVDAISGATYSSKVILLAIQNALTQSITSK